MTQSASAPRLWRRFSLALFLIAAAALLGQFSFAQVPSRITPSFNASEAGPLKGSLHPLARAEFDRGRVSSITKVPRMSLVFAPSAAQQAALVALLAAQQDPASPSYHQWLTPAQYAAQFGMSSDDIATTTAWLEAQGFVILDVANGRDAIHFSGTVAQIEASFHTEMHQYLVDGTMHIANSTALTMPAALAASVAGVHGIAQFRPRPMHSAIRYPSADASKPEFTSSISGSHYLAPSDITTIYDIKALYNAGYTGSGQTIAIVGQSAIATADIDAFRAASGLATKEPTLMLVPNTGVSAITNSDDEGESDLDLQWSNAIAPNATVDFVYTGNAANVGVFDALEYAIQNNVAPIVSISYGECEVYAGSDPATLEPIFRQANAQGQTILSSSGDQGSTGCDDSPPATQGLAISYPASSPSVTAMGGTQFNESSTSQNYWNTTNGSDSGSAISYIPETVWNETAAVIAADATDPSAAQLTSTGGGKSILFGKPSWQVATGVPADGARDVPDISLDAAVLHDGFLFCSAGSCTNGFRNANNNLTTAGGTSFDAPIFAGILALINQKNSATGAGNINPELYSLANTVPTAFHDITTGNNSQPCASGSIDCAAGASPIGYSAAAGYDLATGLGTLDVYALALAFPTPVTVTGGAPVATTITLSSSSGAPVTGTAVNLTATVAAQSGTTAPTGSVSFVVDSAAAVSVNLVNGVATYPATFTTTGTHSVTATYTGSSAYSTSTSNLTITVASSTTTGSFTLAATSVTVASGSSVNSTLTVTPVGGYTGTVGLNYAATAAFTGCIFANDVGVGSGAVSTTLVVDTLQKDCVTSGARHLLTRTNQAKTVAQSGGQGSSGEERRYPVAVAAVILGLAFLGRRRKVWPAMVVATLAGLGMLSGCGGGSSSSSTPITPATTYTITLTGTDNFHSTLTASTTFTVTVQ